MNLGKDLSSSSIFATESYTDADSYFLVPVSASLDGSFDIAGMTGNGTLPVVITPSVDTVDSFPANFIPVSEFSNTSLHFGGETATTSTFCTLPDFYVAANSTISNAQVMGVSNDQGHFYESSDRIGHASENGRDAAPTTSIEQGHWICELCGYQTDNKTQYVEHEKLWNGERHYRCECCEEIFSQVETFTAHGKQCRLSKPFRCDCGETFNREINCVIHSATHNLEGKEFRCPICHDTFRREASFRGHLKLHAVDDVVSCIICEEEFTSNEELRHHMRTTHTSTKPTVSVHICKQCGATFKRPLELAEHMITHKKIKESLKTSYRRNRKPFKKSTGRYECKICSKTFDKKSTLDRHLLIHTGQKPFSCKVCGKDFNQKGSLMFHEAKHLPEKPHACLLCGAGFSQRGNLRTHVKRVHPATVANSEKVWECNRCSCSFKSSNSLQAHLSKRHSDNPTETVKVGKPKKDTGNIINTQQQGSSDTISIDHFDKRNFEVNPSSVPSEMMDGHQVQRPDAAPIHSDNSGKKISRTNNLQCATCNKRFSKSTDLTRHIRTHTGERPFSCEICPQKFALRSTLDKHVRSHHLKLKCAKCYICWKELSNSFTLAKHLRIHNRETIDCELCQRKFRTSADLRRHMKRSHQDQGQVHHAKPQEQFQPTMEMNQPLVETSGGILRPLKKRGESTASSSHMNNAIRPYFCLYCPKTFQKRSHMDEHIRSHENKRPYMCQIGSCRRQFFTASALRDHMLIHSGVRRHICSLCKKAFLTRRSLTRHMFVHSDPSIRPFICPYCGKRFKRGVLCRRHMKLHRGKGMESMTTNPIIPIENGNQLGFDDHSAIQMPMDESRIVAAFSNIAEPSMGIETTTDDNAAIQGPFHSYQANDGGMPNENQINSLISCWDSNNQHSTSVGQLYTFPNAESVLHTPDCGIPDVGPLITPVTSFQVNHSLLLCEFCPLAFEDEMQLSQHINTVHNQTGGNVPNGNGAILHQPMAQYSSQKNTLMVFDSRKRQNSQSRSQAYSCVICGQNFTRGIHLTRHVYEAHPNTTATSTWDGQSRQVTTSQPQSYQATIAERSHGHYVNTMNSSGGVTHEQCHQITPHENQFINVPNSQQIWDSNDARLLCEPLPLVGQQFNETMTGDGNTRTCPCCGKPFKKPSDLIRHIRTHTDERPFKCACGRSFRLKGALVSHQKTHETNRSPMHQCQVCNKILASLGALKAHLRSHTNEKTFPCPQCDEQLRSAAQLKQHLTRNHGSGQRSKQNTTLSSSGESSAFMQVASRNTVDTGLADDDRLGLTFSYNGDDMVQLTVQRIFDHVPMTDVHAVVQVGFLRQLVAQGLSLSIPFPFGGVNKNFTLDPNAIYEIGLQEFMQNGNVDSFATQPGTTYQAINHTEPSTPSTYLVFPEHHFNESVDGQFTKTSGTTNDRASFIVECKICDLRFSNMQDSRLHFQSMDHQTAIMVNRETNGPSHMCDMCGKMFVTRLRLIRHIRSHSGEKPFQCSICGECFSQKNSLKKHHLAKHTDVRPHVCPTCGRQFTLKYNMETHIRRVHEKRIENDMSEDILSSDEPIRTYLLDL